MTAGAFGRASRGSELDTDLIAEGVVDLAEELRAYAAAAPAARAALTDRVVAALDVELAERTQGIAPVVPLPVRSRLTVGVRPASLRSLLAAAALVAVLGASVAFAAAGGLPFHLPPLGAPELPAAAPSDTQQPVAPGDEDGQGPTDEEADEDSSADPSADLDGDEDENSDEDSPDGDENKDDDADEDSNDGDEDADEDSNDGDEDAGDEDADEDDDSTEGQDESDEDGDTNDGQAPSDDSDDDSADSGNSEES